MMLPGDAGSEYDWDQFVADCVRIAYVLGDNVAVNGIRNVYCDDHIYITYRGVAGSMDISFKFHGSEKNQDIMWFAPQHVPDVSPYHRRHVLGLVMQAEERILAQPVSVYLYQAPAPI